MAAWSRLLRREGPVDKADHYADDNPLDQVHDALLDGQCQPDIQVDVIMHHKSAQREDSDQCTESAPSAIPEPSRYSLA